MKGLLAALAASGVSVAASFAAALVVFAEGMADVSGPVINAIANLGDNPLAMALTALAFVTTEIGKRLCHLVLDGLVRVGRLLAIPLMLAERLFEDWLEARSPYPRASASLDRIKQPQPTEGQDEKAD